MIRGGFMPSLFYFPMKKIIYSLLSIILLAGPAFADSYSVPDGFRTIIRLVGGLFFGLLNSSDYLISLTFLGIGLVLVIGFLFAFLALAVSIVLGVFRR